MRGGETEATDHPSSIILADSILSLYYRFFVTIKKRLEQAPLSSVLRAGRWTGAAALGLYNRITLRKVSPRSMA